MPKQVYAVEKNENGTWTVVGSRVFATEGDAEYFLEDYVETDMSGRATGVDFRVNKYRLIE